MPTALFNSIHNIARDKKETQTHINSLMSFIFLELHNRIWKPRNDIIAKMPEIAQKSKRFWEKRSQAHTLHFNQEYAIERNEGVIEGDRKYNSWQEIIEWQLMNGQHMSVLLEG